MMRVNRLLVATAALFIAVLPARADQILGPGRITSSNKLVLPGGPTLGTYQNGKFISQPDELQIQGAGSTGDVSGMSAKPNGATASRPLSGKLADSVSVLDFGVTCSGNPSDAASDTVKINQALTTGLKILRFPPRYCVVGNIIVPDGTAIEGDGDATVLFLAPGTTTGVSLGTSAALRRLTIDGNADQQASGSDCVLASGVGNVTVDNVKMIRCKRRAVSFLNNTDRANSTVSGVINSRLGGTYEEDLIHWENSGNILIAGNTLTGAAQVAFGDSGTTPFASSDIKVVDNTIIAGTNGSYLRTTLTNVLGVDYIDPSKAYSSNVTIRGNTFRDQSHYGIIVGASDVLIDGNRFINVGHPEVLSNFTNTAINGPGRRITVTNNTFDGIGGNAFDAGGTDSCIFSNNTVKRVNTYAVELSSTTNCIVSNNDIYTTWQTTSANSPTNAAIMVSQDLNTILPSLRVRAYGNRITGNTIRKLGGSLRAVQVRDDATDTQATLTYISGNIAKGFGVGTTFQNGSPSTVLRDNTTDDAATANGAWTSYTPTLSCPSGTLTSASATGRYFVSPGGAIQFQVAVSIATNGSCSGYGLIASLPRQINPAGAKAIGRASTGSGVISGDLSPFDSNVVLQAFPGGGYPGGDGATLSITGTYLPN